MLRFVLRSRTSTTKLHFFICLLLLTISAFAKDTPQQVIDWPQSGTLALRFSFTKFKELGSLGNSRNYITDTTVENLSSKPIPTGVFSIYLFDKNKVRIGDGSISITNVGPGETIKFQTKIQARGTPVSISLSAAAQAARTISMTVNSVPQGALLKVDGKEVGTTPKLIDVGIGKHFLSFSKEGFNAGTFPLEELTESRPGVHFRGQAESRIRRTRRLYVRPYPKPCNLRNLQKYNGSHRQETFESLPSFNANFLSRHVIVFPA